MLIVNALVATFGEDDRLIEDGAIYIEGDRIVEIGKTVELSEKYNDAHVLDAHGQLVGINFDRAYEATINDYAWNESYSRSIAVDIRYVLWIREYYSQARNILVELGL